MKNGQKNLRRVLVGIVGLTSLALAVADWKGSQWGHNHWAFEMWLILLAALALFIAITGRLLQGTR